MPENTDVESHIPADVLKRHRTARGEAEIP